MAIHNIEIAKIFTKLADLLEIQDANPFRVRAYRNAARVIGGMSKEMSDLVAEGADLTEIPSIGEAIAIKIKTIVITGELPLLKRVEKRTPGVLSEMMKVEGLGPKRVKMLYQKLKVRSIRDLNHALDTGKIRKLPGFGEKTETKIKESLKHVGEYSKRIKLSDAMIMAESILLYLKKNEEIKDIEIAGSYRRRKETLGDLDVLATAKNDSAVINHFTNFNEIAEVLSKGTTRSAIRLRSGVRVDLRVVPQASYGAALLYFTGSKPHNIEIRKLALKKKLKINEYGVFKGKTQVAGKTETEVYRQVGLSYIEPELREDRGEIEAAKKGVLPKLITLNEIRGDLHCHTKATDGIDSLEAMALAAERRGYEYIAITDHSKHLAFTHGFDKKALSNQIKTIDKLNAKMNKIVILKAIEVDILEDGMLDLPNDILKELDLTVCSVHYKFNLSTKKQTERIIRAMDNPYCNILAHPTGRLINQRQSYPVNIESIMKAAKERNCFLEINGQPERLDLDDVYSKMAKDMQLKLVISTDAHSVDQLDYMKFGIYQARRGWLEKKDVLNTRKLSDFKKLLRRN